MAVRRVHGKHSRLTQQVVAELLLSQRQHRARFELRAELSRELEQATARLDIEDALVRRGRPPACFVSW
jgi:hypothetical protein